MALEGSIVFPCPTLQIQLGADEGCMIGIAQGIMGRAAGLDSAQLHRRFQGLLDVHLAAVAFGPFLRELLHRRNFALLQRFQHRCPDLCQFLHFAASRSRSSNAHQ